MCELLGLAFNEPVSVRISFRGFQHGAQRNPDGWGLAWFTGSEARIQKEPVPADTSDGAREVLRDGQISSRIFIGHVRLASCGGRSFVNTHPFQRDFRDSPIIWAHNGTLVGLPSATRFEPGGQTDSEIAFCRFLSWMDEQNVSFSNYAEIEGWLHQLNGNGTMNLLFSNGRELFAYRDRGGHNGLCLTYREAPFSRVKLVDEDWDVDLTKEKRKSEHGFLIASRALTDEPWVNLDCGRLLVLRQGEAVYGDPRT